MVKLRAPVHHSHINPFGMYQKATLILTKLSVGAHSERLGKNTP